FRSSSYLYTSTAVPQRSVLPATVFANLLQRIRLPELQMSRGFRRHKSSHEFELCPGRSSRQGRSRHARCASLSRIVCENASHNFLLRCNRVPPLRTEPRWAVVSPSILFPSRSGTPVFAFRCAPLPKCGACPRSHL